MVFNNAVSDVVMRCDECGERQEVKLKRRKLHSSLVEQYLQCRRCKVETTSYITNNKIRRLIKDNNAIRENENKTAADMRLLNENQNEIDKMMDDLKQRYGK